MWQIMSCVFPTLSLSAFANPALSLLRTLRIHKVDPCLRLAGTVLDSHLVCVPPECPVDTYLLGSSLV